MARSSTVVGHVGYHLSMAVVKSQAESDYRWEREVVKEAGEIRKREKKSRIRTHTLSMVNPQFFALSVWEPSIGRADAHVHDKVEFYITMFLKNNEE
jgi:hypothetical protein